ncbi:MAG: hypothetical protein LW850_15655 [Planctomycetaceae bacterium]|jgi:hypothetical protein|nr:hypothetical protein [Planctomycetaceae bacterium]
MSFLRQLFSVDANRSGACSSISLSVGLVSDESSVSDFFDDEEEDLSLSLGSTTDEGDMDEIDTRNEKNEQREIHE